MGLYDIFYPDGSSVPYSERDTYAELNTDEQMAIRFFKRNYYPDGELISIARYFELKDAYEKAKPKSSDA